MPISNKFIMMKFLKILAAILIFAAPKSGFAQNLGDKLLGVYHAVEEGRESKIRFTREADGTYKGQIFWLKNPNNPDGTPKYDLKNKNVALRSVRADQVVVVWGMTYDQEDNRWEGGRVYNPTSGKNYNCTISFEDEKTLKVRGSIGPVGLSRYWTKIE